MYKIKSVTNKPFTGLLITLILHDFCVMKYIYKVSLFVNIEREILEMSVGYVLKHCNYHLLVEAEVVFCT